MQGGEHSETAGTVVVEPLGGQPTVVGVVGDGRADDAIRLAGGDWPRLDVALYARESSDVGRQRTVVPVVPSVPRIPARGDWRALHEQAVAEWLDGYRDYGGPAEYEQRFIESVIPCESNWQIEPGNPNYIGPMQWHPDSWARASAGTGLTDRYSWYAHGAATAWWVVRIEHPGGGGGWPTCWWR